MQEDPPTEQALMLLTQKSLGQEQASQVPPHHPAQLWRQRILRRL